MTFLVTLFDHKLQVYKNSPNWNIFGIFNELLSTKNVNVARFALQVDETFFCNFLRFLEKIWTCRKYGSSQLNLSCFSESKALNPPLGNKITHLLKKNDGTPPQWLKFTKKVSFAKLCPNQQLIFTKIRPLIFWMLELQNETF